MSDQYTVDLTCNWCQGNFTYKSPPGIAKEAIQRVGCVWCHKSIYIPIDRLRLIRDYDVDDSD